jgi:hypothetical protein
LVGDLVSVTRHVVDRLLTDRTLAFRPLPATRCRFGYVLSLDEKRDRGYALREPADRM